MSLAPSETADTRPPMTPRALAVALVLLSMIQLMIVLDGTIANIALPQIGVDLGIDESLYTWVITGYALMFGGFLLVGGRLGDRYGFRRVFIAGLVLVAASSLLGGLATDSTMMFAARGLQGLGAALAAPSALALITTTFPEGRERNRAYAFYAAMSGAGSGVGLLLGGWLTGLDGIGGIDVSGWRLTFLLNVPVALAVALLAPRFLRESGRSSGALDVPGALTSVAGLVSLVYGLTRAGEQDAGWSDPLTIVAVAAGVVLLVAFVLIEKGAKDPLLPLGVVTDRNRAVSITALMLGMSGMFTMFFLLTLFVQRIMGFSAFETGLVFLPLAIGIIVGATIASKLLPILDPRWVGGAGALLASFALLMFSRIPVETSPSVVLAALREGQAVGHDLNYWAHIFPYLSLVALGMGMVNAVLTPTAMHRVDPAHVGVASGVVNTAQQIGGAIGLSVLGAIAAAVSAGRVDGVRDQIVSGAEGDQDLVAEALFQATFTAGASDALLIAAGLLLVASSLVFMGLRVTRAELIPEALKDAAVS